MDEFSLFSNDPFNRGVRCIRLDTTARRVFAFWLLTWVAPAILSLVDGVAIRPSARESFLLDFAAYSQFWFGVPILLLAERFIDERVRDAVNSFINCDLVRPEDQNRFKNIGDWVRKIAERWWIVDLIVLIPIAYILAQVFLRGELASGSSSWHALLTPGGKALTLAGRWVGYISVPCLNYLLARGVCKVILWFIFLICVSCLLKLRVIVTHPDLAGEFGFLGEVQEAFGWPILAVGCMVAATVGYKLYIEQASPLSLATAGMVVAFVILAPTTFLAPLCFFTHQLYTAKHKGLDQYSKIAAQCAHNFERKWIDSFAHKEDGFLGSSDIQSYASLGSIFDTVRRMKIVPFDFETFAILLSAAVGPMLPLIGSIFPEAKRIMELFAR